MALQGRVSGRLGCEGIRPQGRQVCIRAPMDQPECVAAADDCYADSITARVEPSVSGSRARSRPARTGSAGAPSSAYRRSPASAVSPNLSRPMIRKSRTRASSHRTRHAVLLQHAQLVDPFAQHLVARDARRHAREEMLRSSGGRAAARSSAGRPGTARRRVRPRAWPAWRRGRPRPRPRRAGARSPSARRRSSPRPVAVSGAAAARSRASSPR